MFKCTFDNVQHVKVTPPLLDNFKRYAPESVRGSLFMYYHRFEDVFVLAKWTGPGVFVDVYNFGSSLSQVDRHTYHTVMANLNPSYVARCQRQYAEALQGMEKDHSRQAEEVQQEARLSTRRMATWRSGWDGKLPNKIPNKLSAN